MFRIFTLGLAFLVENTFFLHTIRGYNRAMLLRLLPGIFVQTFKMICSSFFSKKKNKSMFIHLLILAIIYELVACLSTFNAYKISGVYNAVAASSKFPFISLFSYIMLKKRFTKVQLLGQIIIFAGIFYGALSNSVKSETNEIATFNFLFSFLAIVISGISSSFGTVYFEKYIKPYIKDFHTYTMDYSAVHILVSMCSSIIELIRSKDPGRFESTISNLKFYIIIITSVLHVYIITFISTKIGPIARSLLFLVIANSSAIIITYLEDKILNIRSLISLFVVNVGICLYEIHKLKQIWQNIRKKETANDDKSTSPENGCMTK